VAQVQVEAENLKLQSDLGSWAQVQVEAETLKLLSDLGSWAQVQVEAENLNLQSDLGSWAQVQVEAESLQLQSDLGTWAQIQVEAENLQLHSDLGTWAKAQVEAVEPLNLQSNLGRWAQAQVEKEQAATNHFPSSFCLRPLQSDLGRHCQAIVEAEEWLERRIEKKRGEMQQYLVRSDLLESHVDGGLAFRRSKSLGDRDECFPGPPWGSVVAGYPSGDGWVQVGNRFLPMSINGIQVLEEYKDHQKALACEQSISDGPALTPDGRAIDLDGGAPIHFACSKDSITARSAKMIMKQVARSATALRLISEAKDRVERGDAITVDVSGVLGRCLSSSSVSLFSSVDKRKLRHHQRRRHNRTRTDDQVLMVCPDGRVRIHLRNWMYPEGCDMMDLIKSQHKRQQLQKSQRETMTKIEEHVLVVDSAGCVRSFDEDA
jgi:hypothetical protein